ncbi:hypothetical protein [Synechococcus sp. MU1611]|uniref:hypothetical protein n=1 Tax=Synechococcus sp. MU1611 TaxID=2508345 RepID=UPI001CF922B4|nr:hypothetical protein [Synechococcus sp. MU1611]MCB4411497.1 hypothetical protein [Synechococcus sp. MU1611]
MNTGIMSSPAEQLASHDLIDPVSDQWLTEERLARLDRDFGDSLEILLVSGNLTKVIDYWIRLELAHESMRSERIWPKSEQQSALIKLRDQWTKNNAENSDFNLLPEKLDIKLLVSPGSQLWAYEQWGHRLESIFLEKKSSLDRVSFWMLRVNDKFLAQELYYRLCDDEESFKHIVAQFGSKEDQGKGGFWYLQPLSDVPYGLEPILRHMENGEVTSPKRFGKQYAIVKLKDRQLAKLDKAMEQRLLMSQMKIWINQIIPPIKNHLISQRYS